MVASIFKNESSYFRMTSKLWNDVIMTSFFDHFFDYILHLLFVDFMPLRFNSIFKWFVASDETIFYITCSWECFLMECLRKSLKMPSREILSVQPAHDVKTTLLQRCFNVSTSFKRQVPAGCKIVQHSICFPPGKFRCLFWKILGSIFKNIGLSGFYFPFFFLIRRPIIKL